MGGTQSSEEAPLQRTENLDSTVPIRLRPYKTPDTREKERYLTTDVAHVQNTFETSTDKYDFLIVFRLSEGTNMMPGDHDYMPWEDKNGDIGFKSIWERCIPSGSKKTMEESLKAIEKQFSLRNRNEKLTDKSKAKWGEWLAMARAVIIDRLSLQV